MVGAVHSESESLAEHKKSSVQQCSTVPPAVLIHLYIYPCSHPLQALVVFAFVLGITHRFTASSAPPVHHLIARHVFRLLFTLVFLRLVTLPFALSSSSSSVGRFNAFIARPPDATRFPCPRALEVTSLGRTTPPPFEHITPFTRRLGLFGYASRTEICAGAVRCRGSTQAPSQHFVPCRPSTEAPDGRAGLELEAAFILGVGLCRKGEREGHRKGKEGGCGGRRGSQEKEDLGASSEDRRRVQDARALDPVDSRGMR